MEGPYTQGEETVRSFAGKAAHLRRRLYGLEFMPRGRRKEYYFLLVDPAKERAFLRALDRSEILDLHEFGRIVASGFGDVPESVREEMRASYNAPF